ncbi:hypothetical protein SAMN06272727_5394 [Streptomyces sp. Ag82_G6-1]|nr:hypothetical protein SAMN06272727_5394 [Streptomyces sp. Ag82_G6-1]
MTEVGACKVEAAEVESFAWVNVNAQFGSCKGGEGRLHICFGPMGQGIDVKAGGGSGLQGDFRCLAPDEAAESARSVGSGLFRCLLGDLFKFVNAGNTYIYVR